MLPCGTIVEHPAAAPDHEALVVLDGVGEPEARREFYAAIAVEALLNAGAGLNDAVQQFAGVGNDASNVGPVDGVVGIGNESRGRHARGVGRAAVVAATGFALFTHTG